MPTVDDHLTGRPWRTLRAAFRAQCEAEDRPCWLCRQPIDYRLKRPDPEAFEPDHYHPRSTHPHLAMDPANLRASHAICNQRRGNSAVTDDLGTLSRAWTRTA